LLDDDEYAKFEDKLDIKEDSLPQDHRVAEKRESPWAIPHVVEDPKRRVVGWRNGAPISKADQEKILTSDKRFLQEWRDAHKALAGSQASQPEETLANLPPAWQAFWSTVPELDAQSAFKQHKVVERKQEKKAEVHDVPDDEHALKLPEWPGDDRQDEAFERARMVLREGAEKLANSQRLALEWQEKLRSVRVLDMKEQQEWDIKNRRNNSASYAHGVMEGKIRSSDIYFQYISEDNKITHGKKVGTIRKAHVLLEQGINQMKNDVRQLLKVAAEALPAPPGEGGSFTNSKGHSGMSGTEEDGSGTDTNASGTGKRTGKVAP